MPSTVDTIDTEQNTKLLPLGVEVLPAAEVEWPSQNNTCILEHGQISEKLPYLTAQRTWSTFVDAVDGKLLESHQ